MSGERNWKLEILRAFVAVSREYPGRSVNRANIAERLGVDFEEIRGDWNELKSERCFDVATGGGREVATYRLNDTGRDHLRRLETLPPPAPSVSIGNLQTGDGSSVNVGGTQTNSRSDVQINLNLDLIVGAFEQAIVESDLTVEQKEEAKGLLARALKHPLLVGVAPQAVSLLAKWIGPS